MCRVQMLDHDKGHAGGGRKGAEEFGQRLEPAGRGADPDDEERAAAIAFRQAGAQGRARLTRRDTGASSEPRTSRRYAHRNGSPSA